MSAMLAGLCCANPKTAERFDAGTWRTFDGRALAVVRPTEEGPATVTISAADQEPVAIALEVGSMSESPVVDLEQGPVRGVWREIVRRPSSGGGFARSAAFLGIPFAEAPVGEHRFGSTGAREPAGTAYGTPPRSGRRPSAARSAR